MAVDRHVAKVMAVAVVMGVAVDVGTGHKAMLYYNITGVHLGETPGYYENLRPADRHRDRGCHERKWQRHPGAEPDEARGHEGDLP
jgi:hypothetical protein